MTTPSVVCGLGEYGGHFWAPVLGEYGGHFWAPVPG
jgi:hypothetical protein